MLSLEDSAGGGTQLGVALGMAQSSSSCTLFLTEGHIIMSPWIHPNLSQCWDQVQYDYILASTEPSFPPVSILPQRRLT